METCCTCVHFLATQDGDGAKQSVCTRHPPSAFLIMAQGIAGPRPSVIAAYPPVPADMTACGEYISPADLETAVQGEIEH
jgi:hypothetical protein